jgi:Leucine-rich repeat (LRR) protein
MLRFLDLSCNHLLIIENLEFRGLIELRLFANKISNVNNLDGLPDLQSLQLQANNIKKLNKGISCLRKLEYLRLDHNELESISHQEISPCLNLIYLNVSQNKLDNLNVSRIYHNITQ